MERAADQILALAAEVGVLRPRDLAERGLRRQALTELVRAGRLVQPARGLYVLPDREPSAHQGLAEAAKLVPRGVVCLLSALAFHEVTTQLPWEVWIAIDRRARAPRVSAPTLRVVRFSGSALTHGVEQHEVGGVGVRVYSVAKTVADCFKYRNKIGVDVAVEALRDALRERKASASDIWTAAEVCRVAGVMRPYLESLA